MDKGIASCLKPGILLVYYVHRGGNALCRSVSKNQAFRYSAVEIRAPAPELI